MQFITSIGGEKLDNLTYEKSIEPKLTNSHCILWLCALEKETAMSISVICEK